MNPDDSFRAFRYYQQLPDVIGGFAHNPLPSWDIENEPGDPFAVPSPVVVEDPGESYDPDDPATHDPVQPPTMMQLLAEEGIPEFDPQSFLDQPAPVAGVDQTDDPTQFVDMSQGETFAEVFAAEPTTRLWLTNEIERQAVDLGMDPGQAASLSRLLLGDVEGGGGGVLGLGVADLTPVGLWNDFQEAMLRAGKTLNPTSVMDGIDAGSAAMNLGIAAVQAIPVPFVALKFLQKAQTYIDDVARGVIQPGLSIRSVDDADKTVPTSEVLGAVDDVAEEAVPTAAVVDMASPDIKYPRKQSLRPTEDEIGVISSLASNAEDAQLAVDAVARIRGNYPIGKGRNKFSDVTMTGGKWETKDGKRIFTPNLQEQGYQFHLAPEGTTPRQWENKLANDMVRDVDAVVQRARGGDPVAINIIAQARWYRDMRIALRREFGGLGDLFADLLGATSAQTNVTDNFDNALDVLRRFSRGDFDSEIAAWTAREASGESMSPTVLQQLAKLPNDPFPLIRKATKQLYNANSPAATKALLDTFRLVKQGAAPKTINFTGNLIGYSSNATIDVWAARYLRNKAGKPYIPPPAEKAVGGSHLTGSTLDDPKIGSEFGFGQKVFQNAADKINKKGTITGYDAAIGDMGADDLQAVVWFLEKEKWSNNKWTTKAGEGGSLEFEVSLAGAADQALVKETRQAAGETFSPPKKRKKETDEEHELRVEEARAAHAERTGIAAGQVEDLKAPLERHVLGISGERPNKTPGNFEQAEIAAEFDDVVRADDSVVGYKITNTYGRFMGENERALDAEFVTRSDFDPEPLTRRLIEVGKGKNQDAVFRSKVVVNPAEGERVNPGLELYFTKKQQAAFVAELSDELQARGVDGFTFITDMRHADRVNVQARAQDGGEVAGLTGLRVQYIPEFDEVPTPEKMLEMEAIFSELAEQYMQKGNISAANAVYYETHVYRNATGTDWMSGGMTYDEYLGTTP